MSEREQRPDREVQRAVTDELHWNPHVDSGLVNVAVDGGTVTLSGQIASVPEMLRAERASARIRGVRTVDLDLRVGPLWEDDADIAREAISALKLAPDVPDSVQASAHQHIVTLSGVVQWAHEREAADRVVRYGYGVRSVVNDITVQPTSVDDDLHRHPG